MVVTEDSETAVSVQKLVGGAVQHTEDVPCMVLERYSIFNR